MNLQRGNELLIIIPAHNEENNLPGVFADMERAGVDKYADCLVINDASEDGTRKVVEKNGAKCLSFIYNLGYGNALQAGYKYAVLNGYKYVIQMDADGQHDVSNIPRIFAKLKSDEKPDIVLGSRFIEGSAEYNPGILKSFAFKYFEFIIKAMGGGYVADVTTGLQGLSRAAFTYYAGYDNFDAKFPDANMILLMKLIGYNVVQIPAVMHMRTEGVSMHAGIIKPAKYMVRSSIALFTVWMRVKVLKKKN